ncbi:lipocalin family protein [Brevundimonas lutea]|uniref:lipocalin family protein n=1 Tax=Brevundimonas lutea TaxID=2293980 RepID=UPI000F0328C0|nr:lipocalin family protein [Brevundimonas lutea]
MRPLLPALAALALTAACASTVPPDQVRAPQPLKPVDAERFYAGRWLEIARPPAWYTDGCVAGASNFALESPTEVAVRDTCQVGSPTGRERAISGDGEILDPGTNAKMRVRYPFFQTWEYWVLDRADDYSWYISASPRFDKLFIFTREVPDAAMIQRLTARAAELGYDTSTLEFPQLSER